jgi:hypothetical protein
MQPIEQSSVFTNSTGSFPDKEIICSVYSSFEEMSNMQQEWDTFVESVGGDIYLTFDWCRIWWKFYGTGRELRIFIYRNNNTLVGLIPVFYEKQWIGPIWLKLAKIVGSDFTMVMVNPPVKPDFAKSIFCRVFDSLVLNEGCDALWFGPISGQYDSLGQLRTSFRDNPNATLLRENVRSPYTTFLLPKTFDDYIQSLNKRQRGNLRRDLNLISKSFEMTQDVIQDDEIAIAEFKKFVLMHNEQWEAEGKLGHFNDWPLGEAFNTMLVTEQAKQGRLKLIRLMADNKVVSYQLCFAFGNRWYWRLPARVVGSDWDRFALGRIGLINEIEMAIAEGVQEIEAGAGHYDYKIKLGGEEHPLYTFLLVRKQLFCRCRVLLFSKLSNILHFCYYRVWFNRLAPKLPFRRRPLWKLWIRTRL